MSQPTLPLELSAMTYGGSALGKHEGKPIFVPYGVAGDHIRARITQDKGRFAFAEIAEVTQPAESRTAAACPHFGAGKCGGCHYQHINYAAQLAFKQQIVAEQLARIGGLRDVHVLPTLASPDEWGYRSHITFHVNKQGKLGFFATDDRTIMPIEVCHIVHPQIAALLPSLFAIDFTGAQEVRVQVGVGVPDPQALITITPRPDTRFNTDFAIDASIALLLDGERVRLRRGTPHVSYMVHEHTFRATAGSFFQVNLAQAANLVTLVMNALALDKTQRVLDLYAGVGLFTAFLAERAAGVISIESSTLATEDAAHNLAAYENVTVIVDSVEAGLKGVRGPFDAAVVDPPRAGMKPAALDALIKHAPARIAYVSCDPTTLARDAKALIKSGYELTSAQPVDMFPQTYHIETVALFVRTDF
jgi:23S rRNA (uracil1939-C5)-methyltransferase